MENCVSQKFHPLSLLKLRWLRRGWVFNTYGIIQKCTQNFMGKLEGKIPLERPRCKWEDNIKMDLSEAGCDAGDCWQSWRWISIDPMLCAFKNFITNRTSVSGSWNKSLRFQPLQRCYCENWGSPASACVMRRHCSITYTQSLHAINGLTAVGRVGNLIYGRPS